MTDMQETTNPLPVPAPTKPTIWRRLRFLFKVIEIRLRFIAVLLIAFLLIGYWDTIKNYWTKYTRPAVAEVKALPDGMEFFCAMDPGVKRDAYEPDGTVPICPICQMHMSLHKKGHIDADGIVRVQLSPERVQMSGIQTATVEYRPLRKEVRTVGFVDYDESGRSQIVARTSGFVEKLYVDTTFATVAQGDPLAEIYSPELYSTVQELLLSKKHGGADSLESGKQRLRLLGVSDQEIQEILDSGKAIPRLVIRSPQSGHVIDKKIVQGAHVEAGAVLFEVADLSRVYIEAEVYEKDAAYLRADQQAEARFESLPNRVFPATIALVHPHVETATRTNRVRFVVDNPHHELRPGMYATVTIQTPLDQVEPFKSRLVAWQKGPAGEDDQALIEFQKICPVTGNPLGKMGPPVRTVSKSKTVFLCCQACLKPLEDEPEKYLSRLAPPPTNAILAVPERAVIDTGAKKLVYIERGPGQYDARVVELGPRTGEYYPVISGLQAGDRVAAAGSFLIDAESRLTNAGAADPDEKSAESAAAIRKNLAELPAADRQAAAAQRICPITDEVLGTMGVPVKFALGDQTIFLCCPNCKEKAQADSANVLAKVAKFKQAAKQAPVPTPATK